MASTSSPQNLLTALIIAKNEEVHIVDAIRSLLWAHEVLVVVDPSSTDRTRELAESFRGNVRVALHPFDSYASQRNWSIEAASHPWIFMVDADERPSPELVESLQRLLRQGPKRDAYQVYRRNFMLGRELKYGGQANDRVVRFFRRELRYDVRLVHEEIRGGKPLGHLDGYLAHFTFRDWTHYLDKMHRYAVLGGQQALLNGAKAGPVSLFLRPLARFIKQFLWRMGFLDGMPGALYAVLASASVFLKYAVLWDLQRQKRSARSSAASPPSSPCLAQGNPA